MTSENKKNISGNLNQIALSLSGGGVRAVGYHLGTMSMLRRLGLLRNVQIISTVSGGSMPGIGYALAQQFGRSFQDFFDDFYEFLPQLNILEELMERVVARNPPSASGRRDLITAMANVYDEFYFKKFFGEYVKDGCLTFDVLMDQPGRGHLEEMIFNATEFKTGTAFRFQVSQFRCLIGNRNISLCQKHAGQIRIADIMAASSCIPVGMEPLFFPQDFHWPDDGEWGRWNTAPSRPTCDVISSALARNTDTGDSSIALMDGGVYDNQGITSTLLALNRRKDNIKERDTHECGYSLSGRGDPPGPKEWADWMSGRVDNDASTEHRSIEVDPEDLDLLIISDTPVKKASFYPRIPMSQSGEPEKATESKKLGGKFFEKIRVAQLSHIAWFVLFLLVISTAITVKEFIYLRKTDWANVPLDIGPWGYGILHLFIPFLLMGLTIAGLWIYKRNKRKTMAKLQELIPHWKQKPGKYIEKLRLGDLLKMGSLRAESVSALTSSIYMDRIRGLGYSTAYSRYDLQARILANEISTLQEKHAHESDFHSMLAAQGAWPPPPEMERITGRAATMATKLWIDHEEGDPLNDLDYLVAGGQSTICYNLMKYMWKELRDQGEWIDPDTGVLFDHALTEWKKLINDPLALLKDRKRKSRLPEQNAHAEALEALSP